MTAPLDFEGKSPNPGPLLISAEGHSGAVAARGRLVGNPIHHFEGVHEVRLDDFQVLAIKVLESKVFVEHLGSESSAQTIISSFPDNIRDLSARETKESFTEILFVKALGYRHGSGMDSKDFIAACLVGSVDFHVVVKSAGPQ
jgi:hypothetical protein